MNELCMWYKQLYDDHIDLKTVEGSRTYKTLLGSAVSFPFKRMLAFVNLKYNLNMRTSGYTYITFKLKTKEVDNIIYAVVYFLDQVPKFACLAPTYISSKGEYRDGFIEYDQIEYVFKNFSKELDPIESIIRQRISKAIFTIEHDNYPNDKNITDDLTLMSLKLIVGSFYLILYKKFYNRLNVHTDKIYMDIIKNIPELNSYKLFNKEIYEYLFESNLERPYGQKLIPMSVGEAIKVNDISYPPWRELFISYATSDMVINGICPSFAISANWTYIEGADETMFDNKNIKEKYIQNTEVINVIDRLKELYKYSENINDIHSSRTTILETIRYLNSYKLLSDIAISRIDEFADVTIGTMPRIVNIISNPKELPPKYYNFLNNVDQFNKILFDLFYACHVMHTKIGTIHLDLHLNNMTIMDIEQSFYKKEDKKYKYNKEERYKVAYIINGQTETYLFPYDGYCGTIIDFSDSLINDKFLEYSSKYTTIDSFRNIIDREKDYIFDKLSSLLTYVKKHKDTIKGAIISNYSTMFKVISTIDFVSITRNIRIMLEKDLKDKVLPEILQRIKYMENSCLEYLLSNVQKIVDNKKIDSIKFGGEDLLKLFFSKYLYHNYADNVKIYEVYNYNIKHLYSGISYDTFPVWAQRDVAEDKFGKEVIDSIFGTKKIPIDIDRDIHLAFLIEKLSAEYGVNVLQTHRSTSNIEDDIYTN